VDAHLTFKEHHNLCMKKARSAEARLRTLTRMHGIVPERVGTVQVACVPAVALYGSGLWPNPQGIGRREDVQLVLHRQSGSTLGAIPTMPMGAHMRASELTPVPVALDGRQQQFTVRLTSPYEGSKLKTILNHLTSGATMCRVITKEHVRGREAETMCCPNPYEVPAVNTVILSEDTAAKRKANRCAREKEGKLGAGVWMWWTDGSQSDEGRVGAATVCKHKDRWKPSAAT